MTTLILRLIPVYSKTAPIIKYHPYFSHSQITPGLLPILRLLSDFSHSQITPILLHTPFSDDCQNTPCFQITPRLIPIWNYSHTSHILRLLPDYSLFLDYSQTSPILRLLPYHSILTDDPKTTPKLIPISNDSQTTPILRWLPDHFLFSNYSQTNPNLKLLPYYSYSQMTQITLTTPTSPIILRLLPHYSP